VLLQREGKQRLKKLKLNCCEEAGKLLCFQNFILKRTNSHKIFIVKMKLVAAEAYIHWFSETMSARVEPKFQIES